ncbi:MAG: hypothetical protein Q9208_004672 [Pyrenodesmia sp. 3 TL-2023]
MHLLAIVLCAASLVSAAPSKLSLPDISIQVSFDKNNEASAIQPLASLPDEFELEAISEAHSAPFGVEWVHEFAYLRTNESTRFLLRHSRLLVFESSSKPLLAVGMFDASWGRPIRVALVHFPLEAVEWEAVEKGDGMYIEMTARSGSIGPSPRDSPRPCLDTPEPKTVPIQKMQPLASLPDNFTLEAISDKLAGAPFGAEYLHENALLLTGQETMFFLRDRLLLVKAPDLGDDMVLAVGRSPLLIYPPLVALLHPVRGPYDLFEWEAVEKADGMYIEMTFDCECLGFC